jgi:hypothetical protein
MTTDQLQAALAKGQIKPTLATSQNLQKANTDTTQPLNISLTKIEQTYVPSFSNEGRLYLLPVLKIKGTIDTANGSLDFEGYVEQVQSQYLQN